MLKRLSGLSELFVLQVSVLPPQESVCTVEPSRVTLISPYDKLA